jgi:hypothetical protein
MTFTLGEMAANVSYTIDGVQVSKPVVRASLRTIKLAGKYYGVLLQPASISGTESRPRPPHPDGRRWIEPDDVHVHEPLAAGLRLSPASARSQDGELVKASGNTNCSPSAGPWRMAIDPTPHGFVGNFSGGGIKDGRIAAAAVRRPNLQGTGWANDLCSPPRSPAGA